MDPLSAPKSSTNISLSPSTLSPTPSILAANQNGYSVWTDAEITKLSALVRSGKFSWTEIVGQFPGRSYNSVYCRYDRMVKHGEIEPVTLPPTPYVSPFASQATPQQHTPPAQPYATAAPQQRAQAHQQANLVPVNPLPAPLPASEPMEWVAAPRLPNLAFSDHYWKDFAKSPYKTSDTAMASSSSSVGSSGGDSRPQTTSDSGSDSETEELSLLTLGEDSGDEEKDLDSLGGYLSDKRLDVELSAHLDHVDLKKQNHLNTSVSPSAHHYASHVTNIDDNQQVIYIIKHSSPFLEFKPNTATLVKVGKSSWNNLYGRFHCLSSKAYKLIPELGVKIPLKQYLIDGLKQELTSNRNRSLTDCDELSDLVAVFVADFDESEAVVYESTVRTRIGGAMNDVMNDQLKDIAAESSKNGELNSRDMVVCDLALIDRLRRKWIAGSIKNVDGFDEAIQDLLPSTSDIFKREWKDATAPVVSFRMSIPLPTTKDTLGKTPLDIDGYRGLTNSSVPPPHFSAFKMNKDSVKAPPRQETIITFTTVGPHPRPQSFPHYSHLIVGQVRRWPVLSQGKDEHPHGGVVRTLTYESPELSKQ